MKIMTARPCLRLGINLAPRVEFWDPDLGPILGPVLDSIFGHRFGYLQLKKQNQRPQPKNGTQNWPQNWTQIRIPKFNPGRQIYTKTQTRACRHDLRSIFFYITILFNCAQQTNNFNQRRGKLRPAKLLEQRTLLNLQTKHGQDSRHVFLADAI